MVASHVLVQKQSRVSLLCVTRVIPQRNHLVRIILIVFFFFFPWFNTCTFFFFFFSLTILSRIFILKNVNIFTLSLTLYFPGTKITQMRPITKYPTGHPVFTRTNCGGALAVDSLIPSGDCSKPNIGGFESWYGVNNGKSESTLTKTGTSKIFFLLDDAGRLGFGMLNGGRSSGASSSAKYSLKFNGWDLNTAPAGTPLSSWAVQNDPLTSSTNCKATSGNDCYEWEATKMKAIMEWSWSASETSGGIFGPLPTAGFCMSIEAGDTSGISDYQFATEGVSGAVESKTFDGEALDFSLSICTYFCHELEDKGNPPVVVPPPPPPKPGGAGGAGGAAGGGGGGGGGGSGTTTGGSGSGDSGSGDSGGGTDSSADGEGGDGTAAGGGGSDADGSNADGSGTSGSNAGTGGDEDTTGTAVVDNDASTAGDATTTVVPASCSTGVVNAANDGCDPGCSSGNVNAAGTGCEAACSKGDVNAAGNGCDDAEAIFAPPGDLEIAGTFTPESTSSSSDSSDSSMVRREFFYFYFI